MKNLQLRRYIKIKLECPVTSSPIKIRSVNLADPSCQLIAHDKKKLHSDEIFNRGALQKKV